MDGVAFADGLYRQARLREGRVLFGRAEFSVRTGGSVACAHRYDEVFSARICGDGDGATVLEMKLLAEQRNLFSLVLPLKNTDPGTICKILTTHEQFRTLATGDNTYVLVRMFQGCIVPLNRPGGYGNVGNNSNNNNNSGNSSSGSGSVTPRGIYNVGSSNNTINNGMNNVGNNSSGGSGMGYSNSNNNNNNNINLNSNSACGSSGNNTVINLNSHYSNTQLDRELDTLYRQITKQSLVYNNYNILLEGISCLNSIPPQKEDDFVEVPEEAYTNPEVYESYINSIKSLPFPSSGRALFECLVSNVLINSKENRDGTTDIPTTLKDLHIYLKKLIEEYKERLDGWIKRDNSELMPGFSSDVSVMAKDVVRTEKGSMYIKPDFSIFEMEEEGGDDSCKEKLSSVLYSKSNDVLFTLLNSSIVLKHLAPFFLKEVTEKKLVKAFKDESACVEDCTQLTNEYVYKILTEQDLRKISYVHAPQIRMFCVLVTSFVQKPPIGYVQGMNDFVGSLTEQAYIVAEEGHLFGMEIKEVDEVEAIVYHIFRRLIKLHRKAFTTQPLNGSMASLEHLGDAISEIRPTLYCAMQRTDYDSILLYLLNPYLLFFRREVESGAASLCLLCETLRSEIGYNFIFVLLLAYIDINVAPVLYKVVSTRSDRPEPVLPRLSAQPKVRAIELSTLANRYMQEPYTRNIIMDYFGPHYKL